MLVSIFWEKAGVYYNLEINTVKRAFFSRTPKGLTEVESEFDICRDLLDYFNGKKVDLSVYADLRNLGVSEFTAKVLEVVMKIPYGNVKSYGEIARELKTSPRAVGQAVKRNPLPIIIPCHRVVSKRGIGGYSVQVDGDIDGLKIKKILLELESKTVT